MAVRRDPRRRPRPHRPGPLGPCSIAAISAALWLFVSVGPVRAQPAASARAAALFDEGNRLMTDGDLARACEAFEASNRLEPRAGTLVNLGTCREQAGQLASAWSAYRQALARVKDPRKREFATQRIAAIEPRLSYLIISVPVDSQIEGLAVSYGEAVLSAAQWSQPQPVDGGEYVIWARAPGREPWRRVVHVAPAGARVRVELPVLEPVRPEGSPSDPAAAPASMTPATTANLASGAQPGWLTYRRKIALGIAGASVASVIAGGVLGMSANGKEDDAFRLCPDPARCEHAPEANALIAASHHRALAANLLFGVAASAAIAAGVLWFTGGPDAETARITVIPGVSPGAASVIVGGRL